MKFQGSHALSSPEHSGIISPDLKTNEQHKADVFEKLGKSPGGAQTHSQMIDGILYDQVLSGK